MLSKETQEALNTHKNAAMREFSYYEIFKVECELGNWKEASEIHAKICGLMDAKLDAYMEFWKLSRKDNKQGGSETERIE